jgi:hypothetical protein
MSIMNDSDHHSNVKLVSEFFVVEGLADDDTNNIFFSSKKLTSLMWYKVMINDKTV